MLANGTDPHKPSADRLALLYRLSQTFNSTLDLDQVLELVIDEVIRVMRAERGFVMLLDEQGELRFRTARGMQQGELASPQFQVSRGVIETVARSGEAVITSDAQVDERLSMRQSVRALGLRSILCVPLTVKAQVAGVVYVDNSLKSGIFGEEDLDLLEAIAASAAIAIDNARLYQVAVEKGRLERELQIAREVQASLLPERPPNLTGWEIAARWEPARVVAGDYYDFIPLEGGQIGLVIADVTDKGMPAALFMAFTRTILRASLAQTSSPAEGVAQANRLICAESGYGFFVTLFYGALDAATGELRYVNAGHNPALLHSVSNAQKETGIAALPRTAMPLGVEETASFHERVTVLEPGALLLMYTDGVTEAVDASGREFGSERLQRALEDHRGRSAAALLDSLEDALNRYTGNAAPADDITCVAVKRLEERP